MPQLDSLTYFNQVTWFLIIFSCFYILTSSIIIPSVAKLLLLRKNLVSINFSKGSMNNNSNNVFISTLLNKSNYLINKNDLTNKNWTLHQKEFIKEKYINSLNKNYISTVSQLLISQKI